MLHWCIQEPAPSPHAKAIRCFSQPSDEMHKQNAGADCSREWLERRRGNCAQLHEQVNRFLQTTSDAKCHALIFSSMPEYRRPYLACSQNANFILGESQDIRFCFKNPVAVSRFTWPKGSTGTPKLGPTIQAPYGQWN